MGDGRERVGESFDFRGVPNPIANPAKLDNEVPIFSQITSAVAALALQIANAIAAHKVEPNPHPQYALTSSLGTASRASVTDFDAAGTASSAMTNHKAENNPHPQYVSTLSLSNAIAAHETSTNHPLASSSAPGLMSAADKAKLNNLSVDVLNKAGNLLDIPDKAAARANLGLGSAALANTTAFEPAGAVNTHATKYGNGFHIPTSGITDAEVATSAAIADSKLNFTIPAWTNVAYASNWSTLSSGEAVAYRKFANKLVQLSGTAVKAIALVNSDLICTLPTGFRPDRLARFVVFGASASGALIPAFITISTAGEVRLLLGSTTPAQYLAIPNNTVFYAA